MITNFTQSLSIFSDDSMPISNWWHHEHLHTCYSFSSHQSPSVGLAGRVRKMTFWFLWALDEGRVLWCCVNTKLGADARVPTNKLCDLSAHLTAGGNSEELCELRLLLLGYGSDWIHIYVGGKWMKKLKKWPGMWSFL